CRARARRGTDAALTAGPWDSHLWHTPATSAGRRSCDLESPRAWAYPSGHWDRQHGDACHGAKTYAHQRLYRVCAGAARALTRRNGRLWKRNKSSEAGHFLISSSDRNDMEEDRHYGL